MAAGPEVVLDNRGWEMVSPVNKNGGEVADPAAPGAGPFRAAAQGGAFTFSSPASFGDARGAPPFSQYLVQRKSQAWDVENVSPSLLSGAYDRNPYVAFSADLARSLYLNPAVCPGACPAGYQLRDNATGALTSSPNDPGAFQGASPDLNHIVSLRGDDLFLWSPPSATLTRVNDVAAGLAAQEGAVSTDGTRIYWRGALDDSLRLWEGGISVLIDTAAGGGGAFAAASDDGSVAFFTKANHLYRFAVGNPLADDLTPGGGVDSVLAATPDATRLFYTTTDERLFLWRQGAGSTQLASFFATIDIATDTASDVTADGSRLFFTSPQALVNTDTNSHTDAYQLSLQGTSGCAYAFGCIGLLSSGRVGTATFLDASADGTDAYFLIDVALVGADPGSVDVYDARAGGGFPEPNTPTPCVADACQGAPVTPETASPGSALFPGRNGNVTPSKRACPRKKGAKKKAARKGCGKKRVKKHKKRRGGRR